MNEIVGILGRGMWSWQSQLILVFMLYVSTVHGLHAQSGIVHRLLSKAEYKTKERRILEWMLNNAGQNSTKKLSGCTMYGRVPCDDWLFTTRRLANPNLLKRSFIEEVIRFS